MLDPDYADDPDRVASMDAMVKELDEARRRGEPVVMTSIPGDGPQNRRTGTGTETNCGQTTHHSARKAISRVTVPGRIHAVYPPTVDLLVVLQSLEGRLLGGELWAREDGRQNIDPRAVRYCVLRDVLRDGCPSWPNVEWIGREEWDLISAMVERWETEPVARYHLSLVWGLKTEEERAQANERIKHRLSHFRGFIESCSDACSWCDELIPPGTDLLWGAHYLKAFDRAHCRTKAEILEAAKNSTSKGARNIRDAFSDLISLRLLKTVTGREGGCWITRAGCAAIRDMVTAKR